MRVAFFFLLGDGNGYVAAVFHDVAEGFQTRFETGNADGGWAHINSAPGLAEVERDTDYTDFLGGDGGGRCMSGHKFRA
jgi:hypothetical protein